MPASELSGEHVAPRVAKGEEASDETGGLDAGHWEAGRAVRV